jgi:hypothetical protein
VAEPGRRRFTIAHEIGHYVHPDQQEAISPCGSGVIGLGGTVSLAERQANQFAAEILMPRHVFARRATEQASLNLIRELALTLGTSMTATACRLAELSDQPIAVVLSENGRISWDRKSSEFPAAVRRGLLGLSTQAHRLFQGDSASGRHLVSATDWLRLSRSQENGIVWEESVHLPAYDSVLTLLGAPDLVRHDAAEEEEMAALDPNEFTLRRTRWI